MSWHACYIKGQSLRCSPGRGNEGCCAARLYVGEGPRRSNGAFSPLHRTSVFHSATHNQTGPLWCWFRSGWACAHSRPLLVSPTTSPMRLGVSPAAAPTPTGVPNQRFEALFPQGWCPGLRGLLRSPPFIPVGPSLLECGASVCYPRSACPVLRHSESGPLGLSAGLWACRVC